jgi:ABC-type transporter Mla subunit MlaD
MEKSKVERTLETLVELMDLDCRQSNERFDRMFAAIDQLTLNVGQLTTQQRATTKSIDDLSQEIRSLTQAVREQNTAINGHLAVAQAQSANIAELTKLVTVVIAKN